ncbi:MAG: S8 family peptidase [Myxococcota bacterium]
MLGLWWGWLACTAWVEDSSSPTPMVHFKLAADTTLASVAATPGLEVAQRADLLVVRDPTAVEADRQSAQARQGTEVPDLLRWRRLPAAAGAADALANRLEAHPGVTVAFVAPEVEPASALPRPSLTDSCPVRTPSYVPHQGYLGPAPGGIDVSAAWARPGGRGDGVRFADIELGWEEDHEDLPNDRITHVAGPVGGPYRAHGTAVLGEMAALDNRIGMVGIAPNLSQIFTASASRIGVAAAIDAAAGRLRAGDVLLIELHGIGPRGRYIPMEYWDDVFDAIRVATARGVIVIEAAGNGAEHLDHPAYAGKFDRAKRNSGSIMVGAGAPARPGRADRSRLNFSNYGSRVDVQGWGDSVATLHYGDLQRCADSSTRSYTRQFGGTSSASPIVAGAAVLIQGIQRAEGRAPLRPNDLRELLVRTGSPQTDGPSGPVHQRIGPRPNLAKALKALGPWQYDATRNAVWLEERAPRPGEIVLIDYEVAISGSPPR